MPHKVRHAIPYDDQNGVDRCGWGASRMQRRRRGGREKERGSGGRVRAPNREEDGGRTASPAQYEGEDGNKANKKDPRGKRKYGARPRSASRCGGAQRRQPSVQVGRGCTGSRPRCATGYIGVEWRGPRQRCVPVERGNKSGEARRGGAPRARHLGQLFVRPLDPAGAKVAEVANAAELEDGAEGGGGGEAAAARSGRRPGRSEE